MGLDHFECELLPELQHVPLDELLALALTIPTLQDMISLKLGPDFFLRETASFNILKMVKIRLDDKPIHPVINFIASQIWEVILNPQE